MCGRQESLRMKRDAACQLQAACGADIELLRKYDPARFDISPVDEPNHCFGALLGRLDAID
jgi:hypothetical protein